MEQDSQLERVRRICLALPESTEKTAWGAPTFRVRNKLFAMYAKHHHGDSRIALWCNAPPDLQKALIESEPHKFFRPPYVGPKGWVGLDLEQLSDEEIGVFAENAYCLIAPKKLQQQLKEQQNES